jgi:hypothetical protein
MKYLDQIEFDLRSRKNNDILTVTIDVADNSLSRKWLTALNHLVENNYHLEKNYCFFGFVESERNAEYLCTQINNSIAAINHSEIGYTINDFFSVENTIVSGEMQDGTESGGVVREKMNNLHRYFEDLQGVSGRMSEYYNRADSNTRWHIRQLNLLCHEYESLVLSMRKAVVAPEWRRPSQLMCWLNAPRFTLDQEDYELFGVDTINRNLGGVYVGVNKAVGKHHWEVFNDEGRDSRVGELVTSAMHSQTEAAGDFDIEWANNPGKYWWQQQRLVEFKQWLVDNHFDPEDKSLTIGHPQVGQVNLIRTFGTEDYNQIWAMLAAHLDVQAIRTGATRTTYDYDWTDSDFVERQVQHITQGY